MEKRVKITNAAGTELEFIFDLREEHDHLELKDVRVKGLSIIENLDADMLQGVYNQYFQQWIMKAA